MTNAAYSVAYSSPSSSVSVAGIVAIAPSRATSTSMSGCALRLKYQAGMLRGSGRRRHQDPPVAVLLSTHRDDALLTGLRADRVQEEECRAEAADAAVVGAGIPR